MLWEWSEYNMIFTSLKWDISKKDFHFLQSACSDQIPLPAQNFKVSVKGLSKIRIKIITKIKVTCSSALIPAFSKIYYLERLGWCLALPSSCFSRARSTSRKREMSFLLNISWGWLYRNFSYHTYKWEQGRGQDKAPEELLRLVVRSPWMFHADQHQKVPTLMCIFASLSEQSLLQSCMATCLLQVSSMRPGVLPAVPLSKTAEATSKLAFSHSSGW